IHHVIVEEFELITYFFSSRRRHTIFSRDWSSDVCSSDLKLYTELLESEESLEKRLELLFLASEFLIHSRAKRGAIHILNVLSRRDGSWTFGEIMELPELKVYSVDLEVYLEFLVEKHFINVEKQETKGKGIFHRTYHVTK